MDLLLTGTEYIIGHPERAVAASLFFGVLIVFSRQLGYSKKAERVLYAPAIAWLIFAAMEWEANREGAYIRLDLFVTWPAIWLITLGSLAYWLRLIIKPPRADATADKG